MMMNDDDGKRNPGQWRTDDVFNKQLKSTYMLSLPRHLDSITREEMHYRGIGKPLADSNLPEVLSGATPAVGVETVTIGGSSNIRSERAVKKKKAFHQDQSITLVSNRWLSIVGACWWNHSKGGGGTRKECWMLPRMQNGAGSRQRAEMRHALLLYKIVFRR